MGKVRTKWKKGALEDILRSAEIVADMKGRGEKIAAACNSEAHDNATSEDGGFEVHATQGASRARVAVVTRTPHAIAHNAKHNSLLKNLDKGR